MNSFDTAMQQGSRFHIALGIILTLFFTVLALVEPQHRYVSMFLVTIGLSSIGRDIVLLRRSSQNNPPGKDIS